jgi:hypothetical protein
MHLKKKRENSGNSRLLEEINRELDNISETCDDIQEEIWNLNWSINHPDPTIDDVFKCLSDTIRLKLLPTLRVILEQEYWILRMKLQF